ncbi:hypothetical protein [Halosimplex pelagicum]|uniref:Uncharacterized protein n=1 Tax=Halosimplex pelagicum TaxID=869886 RepID=A0A7D5TEF0_9EURY|nr:hypothetical protein [Halosimplex pelagicum]QLH83835.1 hypothetical protein HZS54_20340 [Halosimplex pelagicum]
MQSDSARTGDHATLLIQQLGLPEDDDHRDALLEDLETAVKTVLADHGLDADRVKAIGGHTYTSISPDCPECGDRLRLIEPTLGPNNGAFATASCECGWRGDANYRLIDLEDTHLQASDDEDAAGSETAAAILEETSSVRLHDVEPMYTPY